MVQHQKLLIYLKHNVKEKKLDYVVHCGIFINLFKFSVPSIDYYKYNEEMIKNHVIERLVPGEKDSEASMQIIDIVERSSRSSWGENIAEWSHSIGNELRKIKDNFTIFNLEM